MSSSHRTRRQAALDAIQPGDGPDVHELFPLIYDELRSVARRRMARERADHTLEATALVHEAYLRLVAPDPSGWKDRVHFFRTAAQAMRSVLVDHARRKGAGKRGGDRERVELDHAAAPVDGRLENVLMLDEAVTRLAQNDTELARIAELRLFGGLTHEEIADAQGVSVRTVERGWRTARAWLRAEYFND